MRASLRVATLRPMSLSSGPSRVTTTFRPGVSGSLRHGSGYPRAMSAETTPPDPDAITRFIVATYPDTVVANAIGGTFFSCNEQSWPNFATIATGDDFDDASNLARDGVFRLNIGVTGATFRRLVGNVTAPDHTALDTLLPHPLYAQQHWVSILNPSAGTFQTIVQPLLDEAHRIVSQREARIRDGRARNEAVDAGQDSQSGPADGG